MRYFILISAVIALSISFSLLPTSSFAAPLECPAENQIRAQFANGASWSMCWESKKRENIVLSNVYYQAPNAEPFSVFNTLRLSQLHVSYDDSNVTYNDVTQFGLGGGYVTTLNQNDCPDGRLIDIAGRASLCEILSTQDDSYTTATQTRQSQSLSLFSTSQVGAYAYLVTWKFFADGSVQPSVGAAGALQRTSDNTSSPHGRPLEGVQDKSWLSHTHNYYWQIDFDLGAEANDDFVTELQFNTDRDGRRSQTMTRLNEESARAINPQTMTSWLISDGSEAGNDKQPSYMIEPINQGHKFINTITSPHTQFDFFVTKQSDCERFISENAKYYPDCQENILQFIDGESLINEDIVVWHSVSFHHVPRNEDRSVMHSHWDGFVMEARNLQTKTAGHSGEVSAITTAAMSKASDIDMPPANESDSNGGGKTGIGCSVYADRHSTTSTKPNALDFILLIAAALISCGYRQLRHKT